MPSEHTEGLLRIGEVARLLNLSVGTLRHYEQMGLLEPAYVDPTSGYRYYGSRHFHPQHHRQPARSRLAVGANSRVCHYARYGFDERQLTKQQELIEHRRRELERISRKIDQRLALFMAA